MASRRLDSKLCQRASLTVKIRDGMSVRMPKMGHRFQPTRAMTIHVTAPVERSTPSKTRTVRVSAGRGWVWWWSRRRVWAGTSLRV